MDRSNIQPNSFQLGTKKKSYKICFGKEFLFVKCKIIKMPCKSLINRNLKITELILFT